MTITIKAYKCVNVALLFSTGGERVAIVDYFDKGFERQLYDLESSTDVENMLGNIKDTIADMEQPQTKKTVMNHEH